MPIGAALGGLVAERFGLTAVFWTTAALERAVSADHSEPGHATRLAEAERQPDDASQIVTVAR